MARERIRGEVARRLFRHARAQSRKMKQSARHGTHPPFKLAFHTRFPVPLNNTHFCLPLNFLPSLRCGARICIEFRRQQDRGRTL